jgi:argininosuccinate lyase
VAQRERWVSERVTKTDGAWLHLGRNRGESLRNYIPRLFFRQALHDQGRQIANLVRRLVDRAQPLLDALAPNYHHLQHSGLATIGEYLLSWAVTFERHVERLKQIDQRLDHGPSTFGGRRHTNQLFDVVSARLGFTRRARLLRDGIWVQDQFSEPFFVLALIAVDGHHAMPGPHQARFPDEGARSPGRRRNRRADPSRASACSSEAELQQVLLAEIAAL